MRATLLLPPSCAACGLWHVQPPVRSGGSGLLQVQSTANAPGTVCSHPYCVGTFGAQLALQP